MSSEQELSDCRHGAKVLKGKSVHLVAILAVAASPYLCHKGTEIKLVLVDSKHCYFNSISNHQ